MEIGINLFHNFHDIFDPKQPYSTSVRTWTSGGDDARNFEPKARLKFKDIDESIRELRAIYKAYPQWFEVPKPKSDKGQNAVDYSVK